MSTAYNLLLFDTSKNEAYTITNGLKKLARKLKANWKIESSKAIISDEVLSRARAFVIADPQSKFTTDEVKSLNRFISGGGAVMVLLSEGGERRRGTNINYFLEEYGVSVNADSVVRTHYCKSRHPKECSVSDGVLNRALCPGGGEATTTDTAIATAIAATSATDDHTNTRQCLTFVYAYGASLNVSPPAIALLSTGSVSLPSNRPVCAIYDHTSSSSGSGGGGGGGRLLVLGSTEMIADSFADHEHNERVCDVLLQLLLLSAGGGSDAAAVTLTNGTVLNRVDAANPEIGDYHLIPSVPALADHVRTCLQESDVAAATAAAADAAAGGVGVGGDGDDERLFGLNWRLVNGALTLYRQLHVTHEPLRLIAPQFEAPLPPLQPATFAAVFAEPPAPPLELFDLDAAFSGCASRLARLTNACSEQQLEYYVRQCAEIVGVARHSPPQIATSTAATTVTASPRSAKHLLETILVQLVEYKKVDQSFGGGGGGGGRRVGSGGGGLVSY